MWYHNGSKRFVLAYNDIEPYLKTNRYRWNIAHELGHLFLGHLDATPATSISKGGLSSKQYKTMENEADYFASLLLVPFVLLRKLPLDINTTNIKNLCCISKQAADISHQNYMDWLKTTYDNFDKKIIELFKPSYYRMQCNNCKVAYVGGYSNHCPICGSDDISFLLKGESMKYHGIETNSVNRPYECPHCKNEEIDDDAIYCKICGNIVVNVCTNRDCVNSSYPLMGNARYCPICGSTTTYLDKGYISEIKPKLEDNSTFYMDVEDIPF